jgi:class 3 adenylate cyclase
VVAYRKWTSAAFILGTAALLIGLPVAVWLDLRGVSDRMLRREAEEIRRIVNDISAYFGREIVAKLHRQLDAAEVRARETVPMPLMMSPELGRVISSRDGATTYRFVSDLPFATRAPHQLDRFEKEALATLRQNPTAPVIQLSGSIFDRGVRLAAPIVMEAACVNCHNAHPDSPKRDWKIGDVRGIQEIAIRQPIGANVFAFKYLLLYFGMAAMIGIAFLLIQRRQAALISGINRELSAANSFLTAVSGKIARYLSPQIYRSIFSGELDPAITTERKKLTIFFSDIRDFTAIAERLQPEDLTAILNEYLTEMSAIALKHGATIDKFVGDAIMAFFGDPATRGIEEDARACVRMALEMQDRLVALNARWRHLGLETPLQVRMGINTGYCNVGNFGSDDRMDYTVIGSEANLAARLQALADPGAIVMSYETYALVRDIVRARALAPITVKGIPRDVVPYVLEGVVAEQGEGPRVINSQTKGVDVFVDLEALDDSSVEQARAVFEEAITALERRSKRGNRPAQSASRVRTAS